MRQGLQELRVVQNRKRRHKSACKILLTKQINPVLDSNSRIRLSQDSGRNPDCAHTPVCHGGRETRHVQNGARLR